MTIDDRSTTEILLKKLQSNTLTEEEQAELARIISDDSKSENIIGSIIGQLNKFDAENGQAGLTDPEMYHRIKERISKKNSIATENRTSAIRMINRDLIIKFISLAAVLLLVFFIARLTSPAGKKENGSLTGNNVQKSIVSTPYGSISKMMLADGSEIVINAGSSVSYDAGFNISNRNLFLQGEAYFKVNRQATLPFIVNAGDISIRSVGTTFNVKAYGEEPAIEMTLVEGSVVISRNNEKKSEILTDLYPNQKAIFFRDAQKPVIKDILESEPGAYRPDDSDEKNLFVSESVDINQITAWTNNELVIKSEKLETLVVKLQRKYDVEFVFSDEKIKQYRITGLLRNEPIEQVLTAICLSAPVTFTVEGKIVKLKSAF